MDLQKKILEAFALILILGLAAWLRFHDLGTNPPGVFRDEAEKALNAWALARTGQAFEFVPVPSVYPDLRCEVRWRSYPLFINVFGVETSSIYQWSLSLLANQDHPPTPFQMRVPAATAGVLSVLALFALTRLLFGPAVALLAALMLAVSPWSVIFSRWALQGAFIPFFITLGAGGLMLGKRRHPAWLLLGALGLGMAFYTYSGARPFVLAFAAVAGLLEWRSFLDRQRRWWLLAAIVLFAVLITPPLLAMAAPGGTARFDRISVFGGGRAFSESLALVVRNYIVHYSPAFLFLEGDPQLRHGVESLGVLYHIEFLFALLGLVFLVAQAFQPVRIPPEPISPSTESPSPSDSSPEPAQARKPARRVLWPILAWLLLFPVGAMLTNPAEMPHALRSIVLLPLPQILAAVGLVSAIQWLRKKEHRQKELTGRRPSFRTSLTATLLAAIVLAASVAAFAIDLFRFYPRYSVQEWEGGFGDALAFARKHTEKNGAVFISGSIALAPYPVLYYDATPPERLKQQGWSALDAKPLAFTFDFSQIWQQIPRGSTLLALPQDRLEGLAFPIYIAHPAAPKQADREQLPPMYVVYKKN